MLDIVSYITPDNEEIWTYMTCGNLSPMCFACYEDAKDYCVGVGTPFMVTGRKFKQNEEGKLTEIN